MAAFFMPKTFLLPFHLCLYFVGSFVPIKLPSSWWVLLIGLAICLFIHQKVVFSILLFVLLPLWSKSGSSSNHNHLPKNNSNYFLHAVVQESTESHQGIRYVLDVWEYSTGNSRVITNFRLDWKPKDKINLATGDRLHLHGKIFTYSTESLYELSYEAYRLRQGVVGSLSPYAKLVDQKPSQYKLPLAQQIKTYIWKRPAIESYQDEIGVIEALLTGVRSTIPQDVLKLYQSTGTIHIMSISGLHVGLLMALLIPFRPKSSSNIRWIWALLSLTCLVLFAMYFGSKPSVMRATSMGGILILSKAITRSFPMWNALFFAAVTQCALDPNVLYDVGFQLSFGAVLGIVLFMPKFLSYAPKNILLKGLYSLFILSVSAQLFTWPILLSSFGFFSWISPLTNLFIVPFLPFHIILNIVYYLFPAEWIRIPSLVLLQGQHKILHGFSQWTWGQCIAGDEKFSLIYTCCIALMINLGLWGLLQRSIRIFIIGIIGFTLLLWL